MMQIVLHQTSQKIADFETILQYLQANVPTKTKEIGESSLHVMPELFLCGYPTQDLCLQKNFITRYQDALKSLSNWAKDLDPKENDWTVLAGGLSYKFDENSIPLEIRNSIYEIRPGQKIKAIYHKMLLPNYDIFDEKKYYVAGTETNIYEFGDKKFGLLICEDMWPSTTHKINPIQKYLELDIQLDGVINLSASPFNLNKAESRHQRASEISKQFNCPFFYINKVGGEDEIIFDGGSFVLNDEKIVAETKYFEADVLNVSLPEHPLSDPIEIIKTNNTWESLFEVTLDESSNPPKIAPLTDQQCERALQAISFGIKEYAQKSGFKKLLVALSGGLDSTVVLAICKLMLGKDFECEAVFMPGQFSAGISYELSDKLCQNIQVPFRIFSIKFIHSALRNAYRETFKLDLAGNLADENIQSRIRGMMIYTHSNMVGSMVLNTSNKSEIAVGYSTQYGDSVGAISPLGDLYKSEVYDLANYINKKFDGAIPQGIIDRPPSAELREDQTDSQSLPPYDRLDAMLSCLLSYRYSNEELKKMGYAPEEVEKIYNLIQKSEYKRYQFSPIVKLKAKSFGFGYRVPLSKHF
jgi:NAD+ synthase (glutamine-hydrolysing)